jgi:hypothetical protein
MKWYVWLVLALAVVAGIWYFIMNGKSQASALITQFFGGGTSNGP